MPPRGRRRARRAAGEADDAGWDEVDEEIVARATRRKKSKLVAAAIATLGFISVTFAGVKAYRARTVPTPVPAPMEGVEATDGGAGVEEGPQLRTTRPRSGLPRLNRSQAGSLP